MIDQTEICERRLVNYCKDCEFDSTKEGTQQPVTIDLTKEKVAMTNEALPAATPLKERLHFT